MNLPNVQVTNVEDKYYEVHVNGGYYMTAYNDKDDIKNFSDFQHAYMPINPDANHPEYRVISLAEHQDYLLQQEHEREIEEYKEQFNYNPE